MQLLLTTMTDKYMTLSLDNKDSNQHYTEQIQYKQENWNFTVSLKIKLQSQIETIDAG